jgi:hypothetical protein
MPSMADFCKDTGRADWASVTCCFLIVVLRKLSNYPTYNRVHKCRDAGLKLPEEMGLQSKVPSHLCTTLCVRSHMLFPEGPPDNTRPHLLFIASEARSWALSLGHQSHQLLCLGPWVACAQAL